MISDLSETLNAMLTLDHPAARTGDGKAAAERSWFRGDRGRSGWGTSRA